MFMLIRILATSLPLITLPALAADEPVATGITSVGPAAFLFTIAGALLLTLVFRSAASHVMRIVTGHIGAFRIRRALEVAAIARAAGIEVYGGCMFETGIAHAAGAHLMAAVPDLLLGCEFYMSTYYTKEDVLTEPFPVRNGKVHVPTAPGLGVRVDPEKIAKYRTDLLT